MSISIEDPDDEEASEMDRLNRMIAGAKMKV
jgi:hypothetical protein